VNIFFMNDSVDLARDAARPPEGYFELWEMLKELVKKVSLSKYAVPASYAAVYIEARLTLKVHSKPRWSNQPNGSSKLIRLFRFRRCQ